jgi:hypothetical protein
LRHADVDTLTRSTNLYTLAGSSAQNTFRTVTTVDGSGFWTTGSSTVSTNIGLMYTPYGGTTSNRVVINQALNMRFTMAGACWPGSGLPASTACLYVTYRDPQGIRGVHHVSMVGGAIPTTNSTAGATGTALLPGFAKYNAVTTSYMYPLINGAVMEPDGLTLWTCDTQGALRCWWWWWWWWWWCAGSVAPARVLRRDLSLPLLCAGPPPPPSPSLTPTSRCSLAGVAQPRTAQWRQVQHRQLQVERHRVQPRRVAGGGHDHPDPDYHGPL